MATVALAAGVAFSAFYSGFISWGPSHSFDGYVGPFTNPSIFVGLLLVLSLILSVRRVTVAARLVASLAIVSIAAIGILALTLGWLGPSLPAVVVFGAFGACGLSRSNRLSRALLLVVASLCAVVAAESIETMRDQSHVRTKSVLAGRDDHRGRWRASCGSSGMAMAWPKAITSGCR